MRRIPLVLVLVLVAAAFAGGYMLSRTPVARLAPPGTRVLAQTQASPTPAPPAPPPSPRGSRTPGGQGGQGGQRDRGMVTGTVESLNGRTLVVKVSSTRGIKVDPGGNLSTQVESEAEILRETSLTDVKKGQTVTLRGSIVDGKFVVRTIIIELR